MINRRFKNMKARKYLYSLIVILLAISSCRKDDNPRLPGIAEVPQPLVLKDVNTDVSISALVPDDFTATYSVGLHFKDAVQPKKFDIVVVKNGNKANVKVLKADVTIFPQTMNITGAQLKTLFGEPIVLGDKFDIGVDITTKDGKVYQAFPVVGEGYGANVGGQPGSSLFVRYEAVCQFNIDEYAGDFEVIVDEWDDFGVGNIVKIAINGIDELIFSYPTVEELPIVIKVNTGTNVATIAKQPMGAYGGSWQYGTISAETKGGDTANYVSPCDGTIVLNIGYTVSAGGFGEASLILKKKK